MMPLNNDEITTQILQTHCDQIIVHLEKAVQAAVYAQNFTSDNASDLQKATEAATQTKNNYFQSVRALYNPQDLPLVYTNVYNSAIAKTTGTYYKSHDGQSHSTKSYTIKAGRIVRQLNDDFLPNQPRDSWVSYNKPHLNCVGEITNERVGSPDYKLNWLDGSQEAPEEKTVYLDIMKGGLFYAVLDPKNQLKTGKISLDQILGMSLQGDKFKNSEDDVIYTEVEVDDSHIHIKNMSPFSVLTEKDELPLDLQEQCTAIIDRLIDAVYAEMYRKYLPENIDPLERGMAQTDAHERYEFYIRTVKKLYGSDSVPQIFERIYQNAIDHARFNILGKILRHPIKIGDILSQLNNDFVLKNQENGIRWLVYDKPYLNFLGDTINQPIGSGVYQPIDSIKHADGLTYRVRSPSGNIQTGKLSLDNILSLVKHIERPENDIHVEISEVKESSTAYCCSFIMHILSNPIVRIVAIALLVVGAGLALSGIAVGIGAAAALIGGGILMAGFFAPKRSQAKETLTPGFFAQPSPFEVNSDNGMMVPL